MRPSNAAAAAMTLPLRAGDVAPRVSLSDDSHKLVFSRLGERLRVAGTAELNGYDTSLNEARCAALIAEALKSLGLEFRGMVISAATLDSYRKRFPADPMGLNLAHWEIFEAEQPKIFAGMINFWCRKPA